MIVSTSDVCFRLRGKKLSANMVCAICDRCGMAGRDDEKNGHRCCHARSLRRTARRAEGQAVEHLTIDNMQDRSAFSEIYGGGHHRDQRGQTAAGTPRQTSRARDWERCGVRDAPPGGGTFRPRSRPVCQRIGGRKFTLKDFWPDLHLMAKNGTNT